MNTGVTTLSKLPELTAVYPFHGMEVPFAIGIQRSHIYRAVITYPLVYNGRNDPRGSILVPRMDLIRQLARQAFPPAGTLPVGLETVPAEADGPTTTKLPRVTCSVPRPTPKPTPVPTPAPTEPRPTDKPGGGPKTPEPSPPE